MKKKYIVKLSSEERENLHRLISSGRERARKLARARVLLKADSGLTDRAIVDALDVSRPTVERIRRRFVQEGLEASLNQRPANRQYERKLDGDAEARLIALTCSPPPEGRERWTMRLLAERVVLMDVNYYGRLATIRMAGSFPVDDSVCQGLGVVAVPRRSGSLERRTPR